MNTLLINMKRIRPYAIAVLLLASCQAPKPSTSENAGDEPHVIIHELNENDIPKGNQVIAFVGATLIDGRGGEPIQNSCVIVRDNQIEAVGKQGDVKVPDGAQIENVEGLTILPGMFDAHYHNENSATLPAVYLRHGITSVRDPGEWNESYAGVRSSGMPLPRLFLTGPHLNTYPPAYPEDAMIVQDAEEGRLAVEKLYHDGATAIKVYYGLPVGTIKAICTAAHAHGLPVMAHLEISNAVDAINAGLDGIEHVTSFGTVLLPPYDAEQYKQRVLADNDARKRGRYDVWNSFKFENNPVADSLIQFLARKKIFLSPTLAAFEKQPDHGDSIEVHAFKNMLTFVGLAKKGGVPIVLGSHTFVTYAEFGYAFYREMELLHDAGLSNMEIIVAATLENARYFRVDERLGSIEKGKLADLVFVEGDPLKDLHVLRDAKKVMLNGAWVPAAGKP
ncbi:Imidazolonepropionase [Chryseolinea serpens]|uniref:Imidazolonepropionase n=2 Tax=Chryseolinea serpens TaxID=947013 RepID=A0A1M5K627_9BACT|nr:Imidazolonepropionase [Chryseolinea serpens]